MEFNWKVLFFLFFFSFAPLFAISFTRLPVPYYRCHSSHSRPESFVFSLVRKHRPLFFEYFPNAFSAWFFFFSLSHSTYIFPITYIVDVYGVCEYYYMLFGIRTSIFTLCGIHSNAMLNNKKIYSANLRWKIILSIRYSRSLNVDHISRTLLNRFTQKIYRYWKC